MTKTARYTEPTDLWNCTAEDSTANCHGHVLKLSCFNGGLEHHYGHGVCQRQSHRQAMAEKVRDQGFEILVDSALATTTWPFVPDTECDRVKGLPPVDVAIRMPSHNALQRRVVAYLLGGHGDTSRRIAALGVLISHDALAPGTSEDYTRKCLVDALDSNEIDACDDGRRRFTQAFGLAVPTRFRAQLHLNGVNIGNVTWTATTPDLDEAEAAFADSVALGDLDSEVAQVFYHHDNDGESCPDFNVNIDITLAHIEAIGPV